VYQVAFDLPDGRRVTVLWNGDGKAIRVRVPRHGGTGSLVDIENARLDGLVSVGQDWAIELPPATAHYSGDPVGYYFIGGEPRLLLEENVAPDAPVVPPHLG
jgi:hypothetical protein